MRTTKQQTQRIGMVLAMLAGCMGVSASMAGVTGWQMEMLEINTGSGSAFSESYGDLVNLNGTLLFTANDGTSGTELWKVGSGSKSPTLVKDINPGAGSTRDLYSGAKEFAIYNNALYFQGDNGSSGRELWRTDGTAAGTVLVHNIASGSTSSVPDELTVYNGQLYFNARVSSTDRLYRTNGTTLTEVKNLGTSGVYQTEVSDGKLYFTSYTSSAGRELWKTDGTSGGTVQVKDIRSGSSHSDISGLTDVDGTLFFSANNGSAGPELWKSNGTSGGTVLVKNITPSGAVNDYGPSELTALGDKLIFSGDDGVNGRELWTSDGTSAGTTMVFDSHAGGSGDPRNLTVKDGVLFYSASGPGEYGGTDLGLLWRSDGTAAGTFAISDFTLEHGGLKNVRSLSTTDGRLFGEAAHYLPGYSYDGMRIFVSDGTLNGYQFLPDIRADNDPTNAAGFTDINGQVYFVANDGVNGRELWVARPVGDSSSIVVAAGAALDTEFISSQSFGTIFTLEGTASAESDVTFSFASPSAGESFLASDVLSLSGTGTAIFTLQLSFDPAVIEAFPETEVLLGWFDPETGLWVGATEGNTGSGVLAGKYEGSYSQFLADHGGIFDGEAMLGAYGVDLDSHTAWAVLNHNSLFAVTAVPEPHEWGGGMAALLGGLVALRRLRNRGRVTTILLGGAALVLGLQGARAQVLLLHSGSANPTTEGWTLLQSSPGNTPSTSLSGVNDGGTAAWSLSNPANTMNSRFYAGYLAPETMSTAMASGYEIHLRVRGVNPSPSTESQSFSLSDGTNFWGLQIGSTAGGESTLLYGSWVGAISLVPYDLVTLRYVAGGSLMDVFINGVEQGVDLESTPYATASPRVEWGYAFPGVGTSINEARYALIEMTAVPEPAEWAAIVTAALAGLAMLRRRQISADSHGVQGVGLAIACSAVISAQAQTKTWDGGEGNWNIPSNWDPNGVPVSSDAVFVENGGTATITDTREVKNLAIGDGSSTTGAVTVSGSLATLITTVGSITLGQEGSGSLNVLDGASVGDLLGETYVLVGYDGSGFLEISGAGSELLGSVSVGANTGNGEVLISAGGRLETSANGGVSLTNGGMVVTGAGSEVRNTTTYSTGVHLGSNSGQTATLTVADGGLVTVSDSNSHVFVTGYAADSTAILNIGAPEGDAAVAPGNVDAPDVQLSAFPGGSAILQFNHDAPDFVFGAPVVGGGREEIRHTGPGTTTLVENGFFGSRVVTAGTLKVSPSTDSVAASAQSSTVSGTGALEVDGIYVSSSSSITVESGGTLTGNGTMSAFLTIEEGGALTGNLTLLKSVSALESSLVRGSVRPGGDGTGAISIAGGLDLDGGAIFLDLLGPAEFDTLSGAGGALSITGEASLHLSSGADWEFGDTIAVLADWSALEGQFFEITGTDIGGGLSWDSSNLLVDGTLTVVPEPATRALIGVATGVAFLGFIGRRSRMTPLVLSRRKDLRAR